MAVLMDTHVVVWLMERIQQLGRESRGLIETAAGADDALISALSFWEVAMLVHGGRLQMPQPAAGWRQRVLELGIQEIPVSGEIGILAAELENFPRDPADRIITATALTRGATLITADAKILAWQGQLARFDARN
jgi:PIN domain nuclease of toxin-antitoxin system